jgi:tRNA (guanine26-N2/guanine27-N2)-dimethyltransferase
MQAPATAVTAAAAAAAAAAAPTDDEVAAAPVAADDGRPKSADEYRTKYPYRGLRVLEALSASGLRSVRYFKEVSGLRHIVANDLDPKAVESIARNLRFNGIEPGDTTVLPNQGDAIEVLYGSRAPDRQFDVVDLDPYGSAADFMDGAVQAVADGGASTWR